MQQDNDPRSVRYRRAAPHPSPAGPMLNRRSMMKALGLGAAAIAGPGLVAGCSSSGGATRIVLEETKPEVVAYFDKLVAKFNASQSQVVVSHDSTSSLIAEFVRGDPPDIDCDNYNLTTSIFVSRGVLANLADLPQAQTLLTQLENDLAQARQDVPGSLATGEFDPGPGYLGTQLIDVHAGHLRSSRAQQAVGELVGGARLPGAR